MLYSQLQVKKKMLYLRVVTFADEEKFGSKYRKIKTTHKSNVPKFANAIYRLINGFYIICYMSMYSNFLDKGINIAEFCDFKKFP